MKEKIFCESKLLDGILDMCGQIWLTSSLFNFLHMINTLWKVRDGYYGFLFKTNGKHSFPQTKIS